MSGVGGDERYRVCFEKKTSHVHSSSWEERVSMSSVQLIPSVTWPTGLQVSQNLQSPISPHASFSETLRAPSMSSVKGIVEEMSSLPSLETIGRGLSRPLSSGKIGTTPDNSHNRSPGELELFRREAPAINGNSSSRPKLHLSSSWLQVQDYFPVNGDSVSYSNSVPLLRAASLKKALSTVPFVDRFGLLESEISEILKVPPLVRANSNSSTHLLPPLKVSAVLASSDIDDTQRNSSSMTAAATVMVPQKIPLGVCGLWNMGNTCYMSAALQCLVHTPLLPHYFISGRYVRDLNRGNTFGTGGKLTDEFAALLQLLWAAWKTNPTAYKSVPTGGNGTESARNPSIINNSVSVTALSTSAGTGNSTTSKKLVVGPGQNMAQPTTEAVGGQRKIATYVTPKSFKRILDKTKSQFEGNNQQDSQEFLSALLDSLHEDLNKFDRKREELLRSSQQVAREASLGSTVVTAGTTAPVAVLPIHDLDSKSMKGVHGDPQIEKKSSQLESSSPLGDSSKTVPGPATGPASSDNSNLKIDVTAKGEEAWENHISRNKSVMVDMFQGQQCTEVKCRTCQTSSYTFDPFMSISLPLPKQHEVTVIVTLVRKMPRIRALMEQIYMLPEAPTDIAAKFKQEAKNFLTIYRYALWLFCCDCL